MEGNKTNDDANCTFYDDAEKYWKGIPATVDGMLGGFAHISSTDIAGSTKFLNHYTRVSIVVFCRSDHRICRVSHFFCFAIF
jgi:hypothetical protein